MHKPLKTFRSRLCALLWLAVSCTAFAQEPRYPPWIHGSVTASSPQGLSQIANASKSYFDQRGRAPRRGYKHYRRWLWFAQQHLDADGRLINHERATRSACAVSPSTKSAAQWQSLGPTSFQLAPESGFNGGLGRVSDLAIATSGVVFAATSTGGLWQKSPDAGWIPLTNQEVPVPALSAVVLEPRSASPPTPANDTIYILTGDGNGRYAPSRGVLMSIDGGATWQALGPDFSTGTLVFGYDLAISRLDNQVVLFAATTKGIYRIQRDGQQWTQWEMVLGVDAWGGYYEMVLHPTDPEVVYAAGVKSVYRSEKGGQKGTWASKLGPLSGDGRRVALAVTPAPRAADNLYALYGGGAGYQGLYVSTDRGETFDLRSNSPNILGYEPDGSSFLGAGIPWYALTLAVSPTDPRRVRVGSQNVWESTDGGVDWQLISYWDNRDRRFASAGFIHNDIHQIVDLGSTIYVASDGGLSTSTDGGQTWQDQSAGLNITQIYRLSSTPRDKNVLFFAAQDNGSSVLKDGIGTQFGSYDGTAFLVDPSDARKKFIGYQYGGLFKSKASTPGIMVAAAPPLAWPAPVAASYVTPLVMDPQANLYGCYVDLWRSIDGATTWANLSSGELGTDTCSALAVTSGAIYVVKGTSWLAGESNDASIWRRTNGGEWVDITYGLTVNWISDVAVDPETPSRAWVSAAGYGIPNVYQLTGQQPNAWQPLPGLPPVPIYSLVYDDQARVLYAGSQCGVYRYDPKAGSWSLDSNGMPRMQVMDMEIQEYSDGTRVLYAGTLAQGAWRLPLRDVAR